MGSEGIDDSLWTQGELLEHSGDPRAAFIAYSQATDSGEEPATLRGVLRLAEQLENRQDGPAAETAFRRASASAEPDVAAASWRGIASYLIGRGEHEQGLHALETIVAIGDPVETPRALRNIGVLKEEVLGDTEGARSAYRAAIACDHPIHSQGARVNLAQMFEKEGDLASAASLFRVVMESGHPTESNRARVLLGFLLEAAGLEDQALDLYELARVSSDDEWAQRGAFSAGGVYLLRGDFPRAVEAFREAESLPEPDTALMALFLRGEAERHRGDEEAALTAYESAVAAAAYDTKAARNVKSSAALQAGLIYGHRENPTTARKFLVVAAEADGPDERARGLLMLGICERQLGNQEAASAALMAAASITGAPVEVQETASQLLAEPGR